MAGKIYRYVRGGRTFTSATALTNRQLDVRLIKAKSDAATMVPVYSSTGELIGLVDQKNLTPIAAAPGSTDVQAQAKKVQAQMNPPAPAAVASGEQAAEAVTKAVFEGTFRDDGASTRFAKAAGSTNDRWEALLKSIDSGHGTELQRQVAVSALRFVADGMSSANAVALSKRLGCDVASAEVARQARQRSRR